MDAPLPGFRRWSLPALVFFTLSVAVLALPAAARAAEPSPDVLAKITKLNKKAVEAYQKEDFDTAKDLLKQALEACNQNHLEHHPITARTEIHIGVLLLGGLKQHDAGIKHFQKALQIQPDIQLTKTLVTPELQDAFEEAVLGAGSGDDSGGTKRRPPSDDEGGAGPGEGGEGAGGDEGSSSRKKVATKKKPPKKRSGDEEGDDDGKGDDDDDDSGAKGGIFIGLTLGSGFGVASGSGETTPASSPAHKLASPGFAPAQAFHISPEIGYFIKPGVLLSLQGRYQVVSGTTPGPGATAQTSALAVFLRGTLVGGHESFHPFFSVAVGGGYIRHAVQFKTGNGCGPCVDTFKGGPFLVGPGAGFMLDLSSALALVLQLNTQLGLPDFTFNLDLQAGAALRF